MPARLHATGFSASLVDALLDDALRHPGVPLAIAGPQGSGKSTLAAQLVAAMDERGGRAAVLSLDDVYLDRPERLVLARDVHPLLATRGPPGTHDVALACELVDALAGGRCVRLPRFDKATDRRLPLSRGVTVDHADLVIVEGWCLRVPPEGAHALVEPVNVLEREEDADGRWRRHVDTALATAYPALWTRLPRLVWLDPPGFDVVPAWRWEQEVGLASRRPDATLRDRRGIERFVQHFERVTRQAMRTLPSQADFVLRLDGRRRVVGACRRDGGHVVPSAAASPHA